MTMKHIFRVPVDTKHFQDTVVKGKGNRRYWGSLPGIGNIVTFRQLEKGDEILFYRSGKYIALATIDATTRDPAFARQSWSENRKGETWELIYFLKDVQLLSLDTAILNEQWGMKGGHVMGFSKLADEKAQPFLEKYGSVAQFLTTQKVAA